MKRTAAISSLILLLSTPVFATYIVVLKNGTRYRAKDKWTVTAGKALVTLENGQLHCQLTGDGKFPIAPESETRFFPVPFEAQFEFRKDAKGNVTGMGLRHGSEETFAKRTGSAPVAPD